MHARFLVTLILAWPAAVHADILYLRDGTRHTGDLVSRTDQQVVFRIQVPGTTSGVLRMFPAALVARVELTAATTAPAVADDDAPADAGEARSSADLLQMVREGFELLDDEDWLAALRALQRAVLAARPAQLAELEELARQARGAALDDLLAQTRLRVAGQADGGRTFRLSFVTPYERAALGRRLAAEQAAMLETTFDGRPLADWLTHAEEYTEVRPDARRLVAAAGRCAAVIKARLRHDPVLAGERAERQRLTELHDALTRLAARVLALRGYTAPPEGNAAPAEAEPGPTSQPARTPSAPPEPQESRP